MSLQKFVLGNIVKYVYHPNKKYIIDKVQFSDNWIDNKVRFNYSLLREDGSGCAWINEDNLELIEKGGVELILKIQENERKTRINKSNI